MASLSIRWKWAQRRRSFITSCGRYPEHQSYDFKKNFAKKNWEIIDEFWLKLLPMIKKKLPLHWFSGKTSIFCRKSEQLVITTLIPRLYSVQIKPTSIEVLTIILSTHTSRPYFSVFLAMNHVCTSFNCQCLIVGRSTICLSCVIPSFMQILFACT
jgi:hypothetical protein